MRKMVSVYSGLIIPQLARLYCVTVILVQYQLYQTRRAPTWK